MVDPDLQIKGGRGNPPGSATSNRELKQPPPRQDNDNIKKIVIFSKTTALHVHQSILYISLTITARLRRETFSCDVFWTTWTCDDQFSLLFLNQGPVVRTPVSANLRLNFNPGFFFLLSKALSRIIFLILFRVSNHQIVGKEN